jgi:hypothetical protein
MGKQWDLRFWKDGIDREGIAGVNKPQTYIYKTLDGNEWLPLVGFFPIIIAVFTLVGALVTGESEADEWVVPLVGLSLMAITVSAIGSAVVMALLLVERAKIKRAVGNAEVIWEQYSEQEWQQFRQAQLQTDLDGLQLQITPLVIVGVVIGVISGVLLANDAPVYVIFALGGFWMIVGGIVVFPWLIGHYQAQRNYRRRRRMTPPRVFITKNALYHDDTGFESLRDLRQVAYVPKRGKRPAQVKWTVRRDSTSIGVPIVDTILRFTVETRFYQEFEVDVVVNVPAGQEGEAQAFVQQFG